MCYLSIVGMMAGGGPLGGGGKPGGGTVIGNPTMETKKGQRIQMLSNRALWKIQLTKKKKDDYDELTGRRNEWGCSADIGGRREERRWRYVWRNWSRREEGGDLSWSRLGIWLFSNHLHNKRQEGLWWQHKHRLLLNQFRKSFVWFRAKVLHLRTWILLPSRLCLRLPSTLLMVAVPPPITSIVPLVFLETAYKKEKKQDTEQYSTQMTHSHTHHLLLNTQLLYLKLIHMKVSNNAVLIHFSRQTYDDNYSPTDTGHFKYKICNDDTVF